MLVNRFVASMVLSGLMLVSVSGHAAQEPQQVVEATATKLIEVLKASPLEGDKDAIKNIVDDVLSPVIDFRRIAYRSMGKYYKQAEKKQFLAFVEAIKSSLINTYSSPLLENDPQALANKLTVEIRDTKSIEGSRPRALVSTWLRVGATEKYDVVYYMYFNPKKRPGWLKI